MLQQKAEEFQIKHEKPGIKTPVNQKNLSSLIPCSCTAAQTRKRTKKELLNSYIKLLTYRHPNVRFFTENESLIQIKVIITSHDFGPDYTLH